MKKTCKQVLTMAILTSLLGGGYSFAADISEALANASWSESDVTVSTQGLQGVQNAHAEAIAKVDRQGAQMQDSFQAVHVAAQYVSGATAEALAPYIGKRVVAVSVAGIPDAYKTRVQELLTTKVGSVVSQATVDADIASIGQLGVFSEITPMFQVVPEGVTVSYVVTINPVVKSVEVAGNTIFKSQDLLSYLNVPVGKVLNTVEVGQRVQGIDAAYNQEGYMLAHVTGLHISEDGVLTVQIEEGIVDEISVEGNDKTKSYVILREMIQKVGQPLNKFLARRSLENVYNTGYFSDVNMHMLPGKTPGSVHMVVDVVEQKTGTISVGAGYSKSNGLSGMLEVGENNLRGTGHKANVYYEFGSKAKGTNYGLSYTIPWLDDKATSLSASFSNRSYQYTDYQADGQAFSTYLRRSRGVSISLGRRTGLFSREYLTLETKNDKWVPPTQDNSGNYSGVRYDVNYAPGDQAMENGKPVPNTFVPAPTLKPLNPADADKIASGYDVPFGKLQFKDFDYIGKNFGRTNSITFQRVFDSRDNIYNPKKGKRFTYSVQYAGRGLGGNFNFIKLSAEGRTYYDLGHDHILALRGGIGYISGHAAYTQLFSVGGSDTLRGYEDDQFRGTKYYNASIEYRVPVYKKVQGVLFVDMGSAWDAPDVNWYKQGDKFNMSYGPGLRIDTPIGPVRLDYGFAKGGGKFTFAFGGQF